jgi:hypothetical protein
MAFGDHKGSLTASVASVTNPTNLTGSVLVAVADLIFVCFSQQTALTATAASDNLGNSYTAVNAGTDAGNATIRCFYSLVTAAGTLTQVSVAATASVNDASAVASVIEGPFHVSPLDANPANTTDGTSPHDCPPTGTLAQRNEVVMAACAIAANVTLTATSPGVITQTVARANVSTGVQRIVVTSTATVTPQFGAGSTVNAAQTTASFRQDPTFADAVYPSRFPPRVLPVAVMAAGLFWSGMTPSAVPTPGNNDVVASAASMPVPYRRATLYKSLHEAVPIVAPPPTPGDDAVKATSIVISVPYFRDRLYPSLHQPVPVEITGWQQPPSQPTPRATRPQPEALSYSYFLEAVEVVTLDKWFSPLAEPVRRKPSVAALPANINDPFPQITIDWHRPLSEPVRRKVSAPPTEFAFYSEPVIKIDWYISLAEPVRRKDSVASVPASINDPFPRTVEEYAWHRPLSEPMRRKKPPPPTEFCWGYLHVSDELITLDKWFAPFAEPMRRKDSVAALPASINDPFPRTVEEYAWHRQLSEPIRRRQPAPPTVFTWGYLTPSDEIVTLDKWYQPFARPVIVEQPSQPDGLISVPFVERTDRVDKWLQPLSQPTRRKVSVANQAAAFWGYFTPAPEVVTVDKWFVPLGTPVKLPAALLVGQQQWFAFISLGEPGPAPARSTTSERDLNLPVTERDNTARGQRENLARGKRQNAAIGRRNNNPSGKRSN